MSSGVAAKTGVTLKGSVEIVSEYFDYALNSILYLRGVYPPESFLQESKYGLGLYMSSRNDLKDYIKTVLTQVKEWLQNKELRKLVLVINDVAKKEALEKWEFDIQCEKDITENEVCDKDEKVIRKEIMAVMRQITSSVTFLPFLDAECSFNLQFYTDKNTECPLKFEDTPPCLIENSEKVKFHDYSTGIHEVQTAVHYKQMY